MEPELFLLVPALAIGTLAVVLLAFWYGNVALSQAGNYLQSASDDIQDGASRLGADLSWKAKQRKLRNSFRDRMDAKPPSSGKDGVQDARRQTVVLKRLVEDEVPQGIRRCLQIHRLSARAARAEYIWEVAREPECSSLRAHVVDLIEVAVVALQDYSLVLDDTALLENLIILRTRVLPTCRACPYVEYATAAAPPLCPSAEIAGLGVEAE